MSDDDKCDRCNAGPLALGQAVMMSNGLHLCVACFRLTPEWQRAWVPIEALMRSVVPPDEDDR